MKTTRMTSVTAWNSVITISRMPAVIGLVVSREITYSRSSGKRCEMRSMAARICSATSSPLASGSWKICSMAVGWPSRRTL